MKLETFNNDINDNSFDSRPRLKALEKWGRKNIHSYDINVSEENISIDMYEMSYSDWTMSITTRDKVLPFIIRVHGHLLLEAPNLISFDKLPHTVLEDDYLNHMRFKTCKKLDFNDLNLRCFKLLDFIDIHTLTPQNMLSSTMRVPLKVCFDSCSGKDAHDIEKYLNFRLMILEFANQLTHFKNLSSLLDTSSKIEDMNVTPYSRNNISNNNVYTTKQCDLLTYIIERYTRLSNRSESVMDFVVELIEGGFENEV